MFRLLGWILRRLSGAKPQRVENTLLILLRKEPLVIDQEDLEQRARNAWVPGFGSGEGAFVSSGMAGKGFVLQPYGNVVLLMCLARGDRTFTAPSSIESEPFKTIWDQYQFDVSVSPAYRRWDDESQMEKLAASLCAELVDEDTLAIFHPPTERLFPLNDEVVQGLKANSGLLFHLV